MIAEDYVSLETAKLLKEKGFNPDECEVHYEPYNHQEYEITIQMAMKWLKEIHNIYIAVNLTYSENPKLFPPEYYVYINNTLTGESLIKEVCSLVQDKTLTPKGFKHSEIACEVAIKYCLENLI